MKIQDSSKIENGTDANSLLLITSDEITQIDSFRFACDMFNIINWANDHRDQCYGAGGLAKMIKDYYRDCISDVELSVIENFYQHGKMPVSPDEVRYFVINTFLLNKGVDATSL